MGKEEKAIARLLTMPKDYHYDEARYLLNRFGFEERNKGKTSGSRVEFAKEDQTFLLHKPHPNGELKRYQVKQLIDFLKSQNLI